jgi:hypothetical protein
VVQVHHPKLATRWVLLKASVVPTRANPHNLSSLNGILAANRLFASAYVSWRQFVAGEFRRCDSEISALSALDLASSALSRWSGRRDR